jgi:hypothetical protein
VGAHGIASFDPWKWLIAHAIAPNQLVKVFVVVQSLLTAKVDGVMGYFHPAVQFP